MKKIVLLIVAIVCVLALAGGGLYYYLQQRGPSGPPSAPLWQGNTSTSTETSFGATTSASGTAVPVPAGALAYSNPQFHFAVDYPSDLKLQTYNESGGGFTAAFQDPTTSEGFEVYVTPYSGTYITNQEFKLDEPSGTFLNPVNVLIDGTQATMFNGYNGLMGDTCEVWFIKNGLLYEVTTYKQLNTWLGQIMQTWQFI